MKLGNPILALLLAADCMTVNARAGDTPESGNVSDQSRVRNQSELVGNAELASKVIGMEVRDAEGGKLGKIRDLAVDMQNGRVTLVVIGTAGWLGMNEKDVAAPPEAFSIDRNFKGVRLNPGRERLKAAPAFELGSWATSVDGVTVRRIYKHFDITPYFSNDEPAAGNAAVESPKVRAAILPPRLGNLQRAERLMGRPVRNPQGERLGKVDNFVVDLAAGRIVEVILETGGFLGIGDESSAVPPQALHYEPGQNRLRLDATKETLGNAPHLKSEQWPATADAKHVSAVYHAYGLEPYFAIAEPDSGAGGVHDRAPDSFNSADQRASESDRAITARIRRDIMTRKGLSANARNVRITTVNGQVTLRGPVNNEQEASILIDIAKRAVANNSTVADQIEIKAKPDSD